jgi:large subunit ribosomal protein L29
MAPAKEFRDQTTEELEALVIEKRKELFELVNKFAREKKIDSPTNVRRLKKDVARIMTVLREKELAK